MIYQEKLHINDRIEYKRFFELYKKYGVGISERDFAKYILDIPYQKHYNLQSGKIKNTPILSREYVSPKEIERIREDVERFINDLKLTQVDYYIVEMLYTRYGDRLSMAMFGEDILGITYHSVECIKSDRNRSANVFSINNMDRIEIRKRQNEIIVAERLHIGDTITLEEFYRLYKKYGNGISEKDFATKILQISSTTRFNAFKRGENEYTTILESYIYNPESVYKLRERVIKKEKLHIDDLIDYTRFKELHRKYGVPLSEEMFAEEVLDITTVGVKNMRVSGGLSAILGDIEIPQEYALWLRNEVAEGNGLRQNQGITLEELQELYGKYDGVLSQKLFAMLILDVSQNSYNALTCGKNRRINILKEYNPNRFTALRNRIILENDLKYNQEIDYQTFQRLQSKYAPNENSTVFAEKVFDLPAREFYNFKYGNSKKVNILTKEPLPTEEEFRKKKVSIALEYGLHTKDTIDYEKFMTIYKRFGGILSEELFAEKILDIKKHSLNKMKRDSKVKVMVLIRTEPTEDEIKALRREVILDNNIYPEKPITSKDFRKMYEGYKHILSEAKFAKLILGIDKQCINRLKNGDYHTVRAFYDMRAEYSKRPSYFTSKEILLVREALIQGLSEETIATNFFVPIRFLRRNLEQQRRYGRLTPAEIEAERIKRGIDSTALKVKECKQGSTSKQEQKDAQKRLKNAEVLRKKKDRVLADFELTEKDLKTVRSYIRNCGERFKYGEFLEIEIPELEESMGLFEANASDIKLFSRICVFFGLYKKASIFISNNIDNPDVTEDEKSSLRKIQRSINYANKKQNAVNMISRGVKDAKFIATQTGISEVDVIEMQNRLNSGQEIDVKKWINLDDN